MYFICAHAPEIYLSTTVLSCTALHLSSRLFHIISLLNASRKYFQATPKIVYSHPQFNTNTNIPFTFPFPLTTRVYYCTALYCPLLYLTLSHSYFHFHLYSLPVSFLLLLLFFLLVSLKLLPLTFISTDF